MSDDKIDPAIPKPPKDESESKTIEPEPNADEVDPATPKPPDERR